MGAINFVVSMAAFTAGISLIAFAIAAARRFGCLDHVPSPRHRRRGLGPAGTLLLAADNRGAAPR